MKPQLRIPLPSVGSVSVPGGWWQSPVDLGVDGRGTQNTVGTVSLQDGHSGEISHGPSRD